MNPNINPNPNPYVGISHAALDSMVDGIPAGVRNVMDAYNRLTPDGKIPEKGDLVEDGISLIKNLF